MKGLIGVATGSLGRYREFDMCLTRIEMPLDTGITYRDGSAVDNYNNMVRMVLLHGYDWLWILGDDHVFHFDLLMNLLERDVDVVVPFCLGRKAPYDPIIHTASLERVGFEFLRGKKGLLELDGHLLGNAGMLIKRHVLEKMDEPWFENGKTAPDKTGCDLWFCKKLYDLDIKLHLDLDNTIGHVTHMAVWPKMNSDGSYRPSVTEARIHA